MNLAGFFWVGIDSFVKESRVGSTYREGKAMMGSQERFEDEQKSLRVSRNYTKNQIGQYEDDETYSAWVAFLYREIDKEGGVTRPGL